MKKAEETKTRVDEALDALHLAVAKYVEAAGGTVLVTGSVQVIQFPDDLEYNWSLAVRCTGRRPEHFTALPNQTPLSSK